MKEIYLVLKICLIVFSSFLLTACNGQTKTSAKSNAQKHSNSNISQINSPNYGAPFINEPPANRISDFVRNIFQDSKGNLWFGTNGDGVIRFSGKSLE
ncbi:two-component regulator propeller domain-containing protein, partial [Bizionia sp.]|uniref:two-component regulator propeller domain-containing protein n=1 Tax=Bizionia sp. TaxID=1954480 RepID=UPI003A92E32B